MTREEAISNVRSFLGYLTEGCQESIRVLIPELKESEDDRIRKIIADSVFYQYGAGVEYMNVLDYLDKLEKQKEPQEIPLMNGDADLYFDNWQLGMLFPTKRQCFEEGMRYFKRLQKEQKPAEWSERDNIGWDEAFACVTRAEKVAKNEEELQNAITAEKWLKEIKFKYYVHRLQKKDETKQTIR